MAVRTIVGLVILAFLIVLLLLIFAIHSHLSGPLDCSLLLLARLFLARSLLSERELPRRGLSGCSRAVARAVSAAVTASLRLRLVDGGWL